ncbi:hypothetical protein [Paenibacillus dendritiformis]|uniref:hypothetical protein n=1 Tax=Paenibacillus dendritiformis TaxID=130049 RepID=UPI0015EBE5CC|nr:hypothetical protein [Paenibacillus dendritiformis]
MESNSGKTPQGKGGAGGTGEAKKHLDKMVLNLKVRQHGKMVKQGELVLKIQIPAREMDKFIIMIQIIPSGILM